MKKGSAVALLPIWGPDADSFGGGPNHGCCGESFVRYAVPLLSLSAVIQRTCLYFC